MKYLLIAMLMLSGYMAHAQTATTGTASYNRNCWSKFPHRV